MELPNLPQTYWKYRRGMAIASLLAGMVYALAVLIVYAWNGSNLENFPLVGFSAVLLAFLTVPIVIYMTGSSREDLEKIKGIIEVIKQ